MSLDRRSFLTTAAAATGLAAADMSVLNVLRNPALASELKASGKVKTMQVQSVSTPTDVPGQLQQLQTAIGRKPDLLILFPLAGAAAKAA